MIDLHLHTNASDGQSTPDALVRELVEAGVTTCAVTDHDTTAALPAVMAAARTAALRVVPGIEITAVVDEHDVHMLGYFFDTEHPALVTFLDRQRQDRHRRLVDMLARLEALGVSLNRDQLLAEALTAAGKSVGRPILARALVEAGHARSMGDAFDRYLGEGRPAYAARLGASPAEVIDLITRASGVASLAHPGKLERDVLIPSLVDAGLQAIEVYHTDHDELDCRRYQHMARHFGLVATGGSDYHGRDCGRTNGLGRVHVPPEDFDALVNAARLNGATV